MRWLLLFAVLTTPALAQASEFDPDTVLPLLGRPWSEAKVGLAAPDSGHVVGKAGTLLWRGGDRDVSAIYVHVRGGVLAALDAVAAPMAYDDFDRMADGMRAELGPPGADGFYTADQVRSTGRLGEADVEFRFDRDSRSLTIRAPRQR
ncbi:hypothetical protein [Rubrivirga marina]|uniref:DUF306 domain-containing protein n=1 Tax=Rubrivirga marina TaxID=1196024 RepID=A0A271J2H0_9BACT|nr:hypothetical protein [Rubrivirga marina]PAP76909.1 hypothetical protein BSZ37_10940 [Rubrivirga marina]